MRGKKKTVEMLHSNIMRDEDKSKLRKQLEGVADTKRGINSISRVVTGEMLPIDLVKNCSNYLGSKDGRKVNFIVVTLDEFLCNDSKRREIAGKWTQLRGIGVIECMGNKHYHSVFFRPGKMSEEIIGYDSRKLYSSDRNDIVGNECIELANGRWRNVVVEKEQGKVIRLIEFMSKVAKAAEEITRMTNIHDGLRERWRFSKRGWKVLRSFAQQTDDRSCGVLQCLFFECMKEGINVTDIRKEFLTHELVEYRWHIAFRCHKYYEEDYNRGNNREVIEIS